MPHMPVKLDSAVKAESVKPNQCFVMMPFTEPWSDRIWTKHLRPILRRLHLSGLRADDLRGSNIVSDIWKGIVESRIIIADITGLNANVMYELGVAHGLQKDVIMMSQSVAAIPFDVKQHRCLIYEDNSDGYLKLQKEVPSFIKEILHQINDNFGRLVPDDAKLILFVSYGGTCRCAMANVIMRQRLRELEGVPPKLVSMSAGLVALSRSYMSSDAQTVLSKHFGHFDNNAPRNHRTILADHFILERADIILAMDSGLLDRVPEEFRSKATFFTKFFGGAGNIANPYRKGISAYEKCFDRLDHLITPNLGDVIKKIRDL